MLNLKSNEEMLEFVESIINTVPEPLITLDKNLRIVSVNLSFYKFFKLKPEKTIGFLIFELDNNQWDMPVLRELLGTILPQKTSIDDYVVDHDFRDIGRRIMLLNARQMEQTEGKEQIILLVMQDITERSDELVIANQELAFQNLEKNKRAVELGIANRELASQNEEKNKRAVELVIANEEKDKRAAELVIANKQKKIRADELAIANEELGFQNSETDKRAAEFIIAYEELDFQSSETDKRSAELVIANEELAFQNAETDKRETELVIANQEKGKLAAELVILNEELAYQNEEKQILLRRLKRAASVFTHAHEGIMITDASAKITEVNGSFSQITGYTSEEVLGKNPNILKSGHHSPAVFIEMWNSLRKQGYWRGEIWNCRKNGEVYPEMLTISAVKNVEGQVQHYVSLSTDITSMKAYQGQLEHIVHYDVLTNLPNRVLLADRLSQAMTHCQRRRQSLAVAFMDLDGFKDVNDNYGHVVGDKLLIALSQRMKDALREGDTLARIGGDEFIAVLGDLQNIRVSAPILERLLKAASDPVTLGGVVIQVSVSIGVTLYPHDNSDADHLVRHADQAMYTAKQAGKNCYRLFDTERAYASKVQLENIGDIRSAMVRDEFVLHYQPKVNMLTGKVIGVEALIRWQHPESGLIPSLEFLPVMEGQPVSLEVGDWVIGTALAQISQWQNMGVNLPISVNINAYQLQQENFTSCLAALLSAYSEVNPDLLELEILESSALHDISQVSATMNACRKLGVRFALDDFGTGYSSLTHLRRLPSQLIKIDQTFVRDMLEDADDLAIVKGVIGLAQAFECEVIAEGVETIAHGEALLNLGCELAQGYGIARPMSASDIPEWVSQWKTDVLWKGLRTF
jgi:diguanylate cyclase (GGDEF)-like protein/PAS domain S-box-containing protein